MNFITEYGGDSSEDEVPGPRVSTKRTFKEDDGMEFNNKKHLSRLPVPPQFIATNKDEYTDNASLHDGRIRSFPHERGNWATFVYIPFEAKTGVVDLFSYIEQLLPGFDLKISDDFHISLTKTVALKHHWIQSFIDTIQKRIVNVKKFLILFDGVRVYCNEERTRTFLGIETRSGHDTLVELVNELDKCLAEYNLPTFYKDPSFHMSIAWCLGDKTGDLEPYVPDMNRKLDQLRTQENWYIFVESLLCKTGNKYFQLALS